MGVSIYSHYVLHRIVISHQFICRSPSHQGVTQYVSYSHQSTPGHVGVLVIIFTPFSRNWNGIFHFVEKWSGNRYDRFQSFFSITTSFGIIRSSTRWIMALSLCNICVIAGCDGRICMDLEEMGPAQRGSVNEFIVLLLLLLYSVYAVRWRWEWMEWTLWSKWTWCRCTCSVTSSSEKTTKTDSKTISSPWIVYSFFNVTTRTIENVESESKSIPTNESYAAAGSSRSDIYDSSSSGWRWNGWGVDWNGWWRGWWYAVGVSKKEKTESESDGGWELQEWWPWWWERERKGKGMLWENVGALWGARWVQFEYD